MDIITIVTSAAVGALISGAMMLFGQWRERTARRKELLVAKAIELAVARREFVIKVADRAQTKAYLIDDVSLAADYYRVLEHLMDEGKLPDWFVSREAESKAKHGL